MNKKPFFKHETVFIDEDVEIGDDSKIWHFTHIQKGVRIGKKCIFGQNVNIGNNVKIGNGVKVQNNVSIYEGVELEDYVFCGPSMVFTNILLPRSEFPQKGSEFYKKTLVRKSASIGANATIVCGNNIGKYAMIGSGSVVVNDIPDFALVVGNPSRIIGWVNHRGSRIFFNKNGESKCGEFFYDGKIVNYKRSP